MQTHELPMRLGCLTQSGEIVPLLITYGLIEIQERLTAMHVLYFDGVLQQVEDEIDQNTSTCSIQAYMDRRVLTIGVYPSIVITAQAEGVKLPEQVFRHPSLQECMRLSCELVGL